MASADYRNAPSDCESVDNGLLRRVITTWSRGQPNHARPHAELDLSRVARGSLSARTQPSQPNQSDSCPNSDRAFLRDIQ